MMRPITDELLEDMARRIVDEVQPQRIVLFGSRGRGMAGRGSDVDLIVVEEEPFVKAGQRRRETSRIRRVLAPFRVPTDILVYSADEARRWRDSVNHVLGCGLREGKTLYERS